jgi:hypothetical protein
MMNLICGVLFLATFGGAAAAADRCGCDRQQEANATRCRADDYKCREEVLNIYRQCMAACYPQQGTPGIAR